MDIFNIFSAFGLSASAGLNAYIPLLVVSLLAKFTNLINLQKPWDVMTSWWVIGTLIVLIVVEFFADSSPVINHVNDIIQSFIRPTAGAIVFAATSTQNAEVSPVLSLIAGLLVAGGVHAVKSIAVRPAVTAATGGMGNLPVSMAEDATSTAVSFLSIIVPVIVACLLVLVTTIIVTRMIFKKKKKTEPPTVS
jgi:cytochrome bd-type quinol oxidase subunit 2